MYRVCVASPEVGRFQRCFLSGTLVIFPPDPVELPFWGGRGAGRAGVGRLGLFSVTLWELSGWLRMGLLISVCFSPFCACIFSTLLLLFPLLKSKRNDNQ